MIRNLSPANLNGRLEQADVFLLDVREPWEFEYCHIQSSLNIPLAELPGKLDRLDRHAETVLICHHGMRSLHAAGYLDQIGFDQVANLEGGIDAWACTVDTRMPRY